MLNVNLDSNELEIKKRDLAKVVETLPKLIKGNVSLMDTDEERKMALYVSTVMAGALMPNVHFTYDKVTNYANVFLLIIYPPASGKGKMAQVQRLLDPVLEKQKKACDEARLAYLAAKKKIEKDGGIPPDKPKQKYLLIPGNTTSARLFQQLADNEGFGSLIFETETDGLTNMCGSQFGVDNTVTLRKAWSNEGTSIMRKSDSEHIVINQLKLSLVLTGTDSQVPQLFRGVEDGLLSRFLILRGNAPIVWKDVSPADGSISIDKQIRGMQGNWLTFFDEFESKKLEVRFTEEQWKVVNEFGKRNLENVSSSLGAYGTSIPKRHGAMIIRLAAILAVARYFESEDNTASELICGEDDFANAVFMGELSYGHSVDLFESISCKRVSDDLDEIFENLPDEFKRKEIAPLKEKLAVSDRTLDRILIKLKGQGRLRSPMKGKYKKVMTQKADDAK
jgi:hypothetical protein